MIEALFALAVFGAPLVGVFALLLWDGWDPEKAQVEGTGE